MRQKVYEDNKPWYFNRKLAKDHGIPTALVIQLLETQSTSIQPDIDGHRWFTGSPEYIRNVLPFLSAAQIRHALIKGEEAGLIIARRLGAQRTSGMQYTLDLHSLKAGGYGGRRLNRKSAQYDLESERMSIRPRDVRDLGLLPAVLLGELELIRRVNWLSSKGGPAPEYSDDPGDIVRYSDLPHAIEVPSNAALLPRLPMSTTGLYSALRVLTQKGLVVDWPPGDRAPQNQVVAAGLTVTTPATWEVPLEQQMAPRSPEVAIARFTEYSRVASLAESDVTATPEWKAHLLIQGVAARSRIGIINRRQHVIRGAIRWTAADERAATRWFERNPGAAPSDILHVVEAATLQRIDLPPAPRRGEFDPDWHLRAARNLRHVLTHWEQVIEALPESHKPGALPAIVVPPVSELYPRGRPREVSREL